MKKSSLSIIPILLILTLSGCASNNSSKKSDIKNPKGLTATSQTSNDNSSVTSSENLYLDKDSFKEEYIPFGLEESAIYTNLFQVNENSIVFPNWDDNNNISIIKWPYKEEIIDTSTVSDFFSYSTYSLVVMNNVVYFSDGNKNNSLSCLDLNSKAYNMILPNNKICNLTGNNNKLYFIDVNDENKLHSYDVTENLHKTICYDSVGNYLLDGNVILYENKSDSGTLYKINIDGTQRQKLTDFSVNSFTPYNDKILAINSCDNNNLYTIELKDLSTQRICSMNGENIKSFNGQVYFINVNDNRHLAQMNIDLTKTTPEVKFKDISNDAVNEYYPTEKGVFIQKSSNVNNGYILLKS